MFFLYANRRTIYIKVRWTKAKTNIRTNQSCKGLIISPLKWQIKLIFKCSSVSITDLFPSLTFHILLAIRLSQLQMLSHLHVFWTYSTIHSLIFRILVIFVFQNSLGQWLRIFLIVDWVYPKSINFRVIIKRV